MDIVAGIWIVLIGALVAGSCGLLGCFLVLRRLTMLGDAISHAILPGIAGAFLLSASLNHHGDARAPLPMFIGASIVGVLTAFLVQLLNKSGRVQGDAAIGVVFTALFAIGVVMISLYASQIDLDQDCVLYGEIAYAPFDMLEWNNRVLGPKAFWQMLGVFALCVVVVSTLFKELKLASFDPEMAAAVGINVGVLHYVLMAMVSITTVGSFTLVGAILVVAMLVVPAATAYLLTDNLKNMLIISVIVGVLSSALGYAFTALVMPNASIAGCMTVAAGLLFLLAFLFSPSHGLVARRAAQKKLAAQIEREDALQFLWRRHERGETLNVNDGQSSLVTANALRQLVREDLVQLARGEYSLSRQGREAAQELVHRHRVYETYLDELGYASDHLHEAADRAEHFLSPQLVATMDEVVGNPRVDPHGKDIPHGES
jgi:manganese/zinc/iron transport system permease protein